MCKLSWENCITPLMIDWINERIRIRNRNDAPCSFSSVDAIPIRQPALGSCFSILPNLTANSWWNLWKQKDTHAPIYVIHRDLILSLYFTFNLSLKKKKSWILLPGLFDLCHLSQVSKYSRSIFFWRYLSFTKFRES